MCDNSSSCTYLFRGGIFIDECGASENVDNINIYYSCLPGSCFIYNFMWSLFLHLTFQHLNLNYSINLCDRSHRFYFSITLFTNDTMTQLVSIANMLKQLESASFIVDDMFSPVAFNAYATETWEYSENDLDMFNETYFDYGQHYQTPNSIFICPVGGIYGFSCQCRKWSCIEKYRRTCYDKKLQ